MHSEQTSTRCSGVKILCRAAELYPLKILAEKKEEPESFPFYSANKMRGSACSLNAK